MISPTDLFHPSPAPHFKNFQMFLIYCPKPPNFSNKAIIIIIIIIAAAAAAFPYVISPNKIILVRIFTILFH
jgi:hypothetical protein